MSRERELLLALAQWAKSTGHSFPCPVHPDYPGVASCICGLNDVESALDYFTRNEPV